MPVTAKLSRKFYDKLGDEVANELVDWFNTVDLSYRSEIRELFETHFSRFEARLAQSKAELRSELSAEISRLEARLELVKTELRSEFAADFSRLDARLVQQSAELRSELAIGLAKQKAELIRWMFVFWIGSIIATLGGLLALRELL